MLAEKAKTACRSKHRDALATAAIVDRLSNDLICINQEIHKGLRQERKKARERMQHPTGQWLMRKAQHRLDLQTVLLR
jgi:hypothetical protein